MIGDEMLAIGAGRDRAYSNPEAPPCWKSTQKLGVTVSWWISKRSLGVFVHPYAMSYCHAAHFLGWPPIGFFGCTRQSKDLGGAEFHRSPEVHGWGDPDSRRLGMAWKLSYIYIYHDTKWETKQFIYIYIIYIYIFILQYIYRSLWDQMGDHPIIEIPTYIKNNG